MRTLLTLCLLALLPVPALAQGKIKVVPVKVVELKRSDAVLYEKEIEPIFYKHCVACHSGNEKRGKFDLGSYDTLIKGGKRGPAIVPGKSENSLLVKLAGRTMDPPMPPPKEDDVLSPTELALIKLWIDQGAKAPSGPRVKTKIIVGLPPASVHPVLAVAVRPDKSAIATGRGNQIHLYDATSGKYLRSLTDPDLKTADGKAVKAAHLSLVESLAYSPDGKFLASGSFQEVNVWDAEMGTLRQKLTGFAHNVVALAFSPDGKLLATGGGAPTEDGEVKIFEVGTWKQVTDIKGGHSDTVYGVAFSPDGKKLASCGADKFIKVFEVPGGKFIKSFEGHTHHVLDVGWKADGKLLASAGADNTVKIWDYEKGEQVRTINNAHTKQVTRLVFVGKTSNFLTCSGDQQVRSWNADSGGNTGNYSGNTDFVYAVSASPDGQLVATGGEDGLVRLYRGPGQPKATLVPPGAEPQAKSK
jgi:WD40 repeat protein